MLGGQTGTSLLTCLSLAHSSLFLSHTFFCPQSHSLNYTHTHTHMHMNTLVTIKQVVLSSWLSPCLFLCAIYELSQLFLTVEPQLTPQTCTTCTLAHTHTQSFALCVSLFLTAALSPSAEQNATQSIQQASRSLCLSARECH